MAENSLNQWNAKNVGLAAGVIGVPAIALMIWMANYDPAPDTSYLDDIELQQVDAERYCKLEMDARLKSPGSAEYSGVTSSGYDTITVSGVVDSQNSFGAMLRTPFSCTVTLSGDRWILDNFEVD